MLILRRRAGESILIGSTIEIEITEIGSHKVKIGIRAPKDVMVRRKELASIGDQNRCAATLSPEAQTALANNLSNLFAQTFSGTSDKTFEARYSGHPEKENLEPA